MLARSALALVALLTLAACSDDGGDTPSSTDGSSATTGPASAPAVTGSETTIVATPAAGSLFAVGDVDAGLQPWVELSTSQLATALDIDPADVTTVSAVLVVWPDASLGCPQPDQEYAATITDGAVIELDADGAIYRFHAGGERGPFLCERPITTAPPRA